MTPTAAEVASARATIAAAEKAEKDAAHASAVQNGEMRAAIRDLSDEEFRAANAFVARHGRMPRIDELPAIKEQANRR